jgi:hypothetical protein
MTKYNSKRGPPAQSQFSRTTPTPALSHGLTFVDLVQKLRLNDTGSISTTTPHAQQTIQESPPSGRRNQLALKGTDGSISPGSILNVRKINPTYPDPLITLNGAGYNVSPLYTQISNKAQIFSSSGPKNSVFATVGRTAIGPKGTSSFYWNK